MVLLEDQHAGFTQGTLHFSPGCDFVFQRGGREAVPFGHGAPDPSL